MVLLSHITTERHVKTRIYMSSLWYACSCMGVYVCVNEGEKVLWAKDINYWSLCELLTQQTAD